MPTFVQYESRNSWRISKAVRMSQEIDSEFNTSKKKTDGSKDDSVWLNFYAGWRVFRHVFANRGLHLFSALEHFESNPSSGVSVWEYFTSELTRGYLLERDKDKFTERRQRVYTFMKTPRELEKFIIFGFFQLVDAFLFLFTFLPLRIVLAVLKLLTHPCGALLSRSQRVLEPAQVCDLLKGIVVVAAFLLTNYVDTSMIYHLVRGQAIVKLYVFYNMLDMADKLFSSFGQDILDALYWTATEPKSKKRQHIGVIPHLLLAIIYVVIHTLLILFQATVLNVAFNSHNKALLTIMMSNNFVEIKGSLFKKIDREFLFHISCSDVKERLHYVILLAVVFVRNMTEFSWDPEHVWVIIPDAILVLVAEIVVDWIKHAFILKFNEIPADAYHSYSVRVAEDMISTRQSKAFIDYSDLISRRMGFTPLPLACLLLRISTKSFKVSGFVGVLVLILLYLSLLTFKIFNSIVLLGRSCDLTKKDIKEEQPPKDNKDSKKTNSKDTGLEKQEEVHDNLEDVDISNTADERRQLYGSRTSLSLRFISESLTEADKLASKEEVICKQSDSVTSCSHSDEIKDIFSEMPRCSASSSETKFDSVADVTAYNQMTSLPDDELRDHKISGLSKSRSESYLCTPLEDADLGDSQACSEAVIPSSFTGGGDMDGNYLSASKNSSSSNMLLKSDDMKEYSNISTAVGLEEIGGQLEKNQYDMAERTIPELSTRHGHGISLASNVGELRHRHPLPETTSKHESSV